MGKIEGSRSVEIDAPLDEVYEIAADVPNAPEWHASMKSVKVLETGDDGRATLVETQNDAKVREVTTVLRFSYPSRNRIEWTQEKGDLKSLVGWWDLEEIGEGRTRATYNLKGDPGRVLGMLIRGPVEGKVRDFLLGGAAEGLKQRAESG